MSRKKRILFIDGPLGGGGAERVLIDILRNIDYDLYEVDLAVICKGGVLMNEVPTQVNVIELWPSYNLEYKLAYRLSKWLHSNCIFSHRMNGKKLRRDYDIEISFLEGMPLKLGALRTTEAKKVTWVHVDLFIRRYEAEQFYKGEELRAYNSMDVIVNVSKDCEESFIKRFPECTTKKMVIYNPIDRVKIVRMADEYRVEKKSDIFTVVGVGRLTSQKNPKRFLEVARLAKAANLPLRFKWIGDGVLRKEMEALRDLMGLSDMVEFTGFLKNPFPHIKASDLMMVTSDYEGFCLVICEAMCLGVPVISTRTAGPSEIIGNDEYGLLTDFSSKDLFDGVQQFLSDKSLRRNMAEKAIKRPDNYSIEKSLNQLYELCMSAEN